MSDDKLGFQKRPKIHPNSALRQNNVVNALIEDYEDYFKYLAEKLQKHLQNRPEKIGKYGYWNLYYSVDVDKWITKIEELLEALK